MLHLSTFVLAASLGQGPAENSWLDIVPPEADVVIRVRGVDPARKDLLAMIKAMSEAAGVHVEPVLEQAIVGFKAQFGDAAANEPLVGLIRAVAPENPNQPPFAVLAHSKNYDAILKVAAGGNAPTLKHEDGGYDSFDGLQGATWYVVKKGEIVACGPDKILVAGFAKPGKPSFMKGLSTASQTRFASGDLGLCVNVAALTSRYAEQIDKGKQGFLAALDQASQLQQGGAAMMGIAKTLYGGLFDSIKEADVLTLAFDFSAQGLGVNGDLAVKADSAAAKSIAASQGSDAANLAKLPPDSAYYVYFNLDAKSFEALQALGVQMMIPAGKKTPELNSALAKQRAMGRVETFGSVSINPAMRSINIMNASDPKAMLATSEASIKAMAGDDNPFNLFKDVKVVPNAETYKGYTFTRTELSIDSEKVAKLQPNNPNAAANFQAMYSGGKMTSWYGINENQVIQVMDANWDKAKSQIDTYLTGTTGIGTNAAYQALRTKLPKQVSLLAIISAQGFVNQIATSITGVVNNANAKPSANMPKETAFVGASLTANAPNSFEFHLVVPSPVGAVIEKGLIPLFQNLKPPGN